MGGRHDRCFLSQSESLTPISLDALQEISAEIRHQESLPYLLWQQQPPIHSMRQDGRPFIHSTLTIEGTTRRPG
jgi:hypothetical protein